VDRFDYYRHNRFDHGQLAKILQKRKSRWLLSYNDVPGVRALYRGCHFRVWNTTSRITKKIEGFQIVRRKELLVSNNPIVKRR
jgi:site-specific DNA-adenine methylase